MLKLTILAKFNKKITQRMIGDLTIKIKDRIIDAIVEVTEIPWEAIKNITRKREVVTARHLYHYFMRTKALIKEDEICLDTHRDRTTVIHSIKTISNLLENDKEIQRYVIEINKLIN